MRGQEKDHDVQTKVNRNPDATNLPLEYLTGKAKGTPILVEL